MIAQNMLMFILRYKNVLLYLNLNTIKMKFGVISDPQSGDSTQEKNKRGIVNKFLIEDPKFVLFPGDLTSHGWNACLFNYIIKKIFFPKETYKYVKELGKFIDTYITPLENNDIRTFSVMGNHDTYTGPILPVKCWIKKKHGYTYYKKSYNNNLDIFGLDIYPTKNICDWLTTVIDDNKYSMLFFHYPVQGPYSNWWPEEDKEYFYNTIRNRKILMIACGHYHKTEKYMWRGFQIVNAGGKGGAIVEADLTDGSLDIKFV
jgi:predicted phosphodiesterase